MEVLFIADISPLSALVGVIWLFGLGMFPVGIMLGSPCSPCCGGTPCSLNSSRPAFPSVEGQSYACDNASPAGTTSLGVAGASADGMAAYFNSSRVRGDSSLAKSVSCENVCDIASFLPVYSFLQSAPSVTVSLSFSGNATEYKPYYAKASSASQALVNNCYSHTTISQCSGQYGLTHIGGGVYRYATEFGDDLFEIVASLHRCNDVALWLLSVSFVSRSTRSVCGGLANGEVTFEDTAASNAACQQLLQGGGNKILRCCLGHVLHYATACIRTSSTFSDRVACGNQQQSLSLDVQDVSSLSASGMLQITQNVTTSGTDLTFGNPYGRPGLLLPTTRSGTSFSTNTGGFVGFFYAGTSAPCYCLYPVNTFKDTMPLSTDYGGPFSITVV